MNFLSYFFFWSWLSLGSMIKVNENWSRDAVNYSREPEEIVIAWSGQVCELLVVGSVYAELNSCPELHEEHVSLIVREDT